MATSAAIGGGKHFLPNTDSFTEGTPVYGDVLQRYIGIQPWSIENEAATGYTVRTGFGHIFDGRSNLAGPGRKASTTNHSTNVDDNRITFVVQRDTEAWQFGEVYYNPVLHMITGSLDNDTVRGVGCCARVAGGTFTTPAGGDHSDKYYADVSGYFFIHAKQSSFAHKLFLIEVNAGALTLLNSVLVGSLPGGQLHGAQNDDAELPIAMRMTITDAGGGGIQIKCFRKKFTSPATGVLLGSPSVSSGVTEDQVFSNTVGAPVTTTGRCGFGLQSAKTQSTGDSTMLCREFRVIDFETLHSRDRFKRVQPTATRILSDPLGAFGNTLGASFTGDSQGDATSAFKNFGHLLSDVGNNRLIVGSTPPSSGSGQVHGWYMSTRSAGSVQQHRSLSLTFTSATPETVRAGIHLRGIWHPAGTAHDMRARDAVGGNFLDYNKQGYLCLIKHVPGGSPVFELEIRAHTIDDTITYRAPLIATVDLTSAALAVNVAITLDFEVRNFDGDLFGFGTFPAMRVKVNAVVQTLVPGSVTGISVNDDFLIDGRSEASVTGLAEGFYLDVDAVKVGGLMRFDTWAEPALSDPPDVSEEDEASVVLNAETVNLTGTLVTPLSWPVEQDPGGYEPLKHRFETGHLQTFPRSRVPRREWTVQCGGCTTAERVALQTFFRSHKGVEIPFSWARPTEDGSITETVKVRMLEDTLAHFLIFLSTDGFEGYELRLGEVFDHVNFNETL